MLVFKLNQAEPARPDQRRRGNRPGEANWRSNWKSPVMVERLVADLFDHENSHVRRHRAQRGKARARLPADRYLACPAAQAPRPRAMAAP
ncbi:hypothetical protein ACU4GD_29270 [Cupriavidus basilensis]